MKSFLHELMLAPLEALRDLRARLEGRDESSYARELGKLIIDKDGNARLNLRNAEVRAEMQQHINELALIRVPVETPRRTRKR